MKTIKVNLKKRSYPIVVGNNTIGALGKYARRLDIGSDAYIITNSFLKNKYGKIINTSLKNYGINTRFKLIPDTEKSKSMDMAYAVIKDLTDYDLRRQVFIVAFGGGVVGDLAGFVASIYKRGIPYIQVPTTLLAQVDSAIGGKTALDLSQGKNLVGAFYQPRLVFSDVGLLRSLDTRQIRAGMTEVIKYAVIKDPALFRYLEKKYKEIIRKKPRVLEFIVSCCSRIKAGIVSEDEREEKGRRTILNFGHTIGHAIEAASGFQGYSHGEAIAIGILTANELSVKLGLLKTGESQRIENLLKSAGLPIRIKKIPLSKIINAHYHDKKFITGVNKFILIKGIGRVKIVSNIPLEIIKEAVRKRLG